MNPLNRIVAVGRPVKNAAGQVLMIHRSKGDGEFLEGQVELGKNLIDAFTRQNKENQVGFSSMQKASPWDA